MLKIALFGSPQFFLNSVEIGHTLGGKSLALLSYLAATEHPSARDSLADLLWSELNNQQARNNLRYILPELRKVLGDYLSITTQSIAINRQLPFWLDVQILRRALTTQMETATAEELQAAVELYRGEFLAGLRVRNAPLFEAWVTTQQEELNGLAVQGWHQVALRYLQAENQPAALQATQQLLRLDPWHEAGQRLQMELLTASGQRSAALEQYQRLKQRLQQEIKIDPAPETTALYTKILGEPSLLQSAGVASLSAVQSPSQSDTPLTVAQPLPTPLSLAPPTYWKNKHNLPRQMTSWIGRNMEIVAILAKLQDPGYPLLSLLGEGGIGKTRLALAVAERVVNSFADGVWFVPLIEVAASSNADERIAAAIGEALNLTFAGREGLIQQLTTQLRHKQLLLVLDNFEHLIESTGFLLELLQSAPTVKLLVTSRRQLDLQAEYSWALDGLAFPMQEEATNLSERELLRYESIALFVERARRARPTFQFDTDNRSAVVQICQLVHGSPLAIELAATLTRQQSCYQIASELSRHFAILATTWRDVAPHHRTMQSVLQASWQGLSSAEATALSRASIFRGGFTQSAAKAVIGAEAETLERLVGHSLLFTLQDVALQTRYEMHELVRQFAHEKLHSSTIAAQQLANQHCSYFASFLQQQAEEIKRTALARRLIQADFDNVRAAWQWAIEQCQLDALTQSVATLTAFYEFVGFFHEAESVLGGAIVQVRGVLAQNPERQAELSSLLGRLLSEQSGFCSHLAKFELAKALAQETIAFGEAANNFYVQADGHRRLCGFLRDTGDLSKAQKEIEIALQLAREHNIPYLEALSLHNLAGIFYNQGEFQAAQALYKEAIIIARQIQDRIVEAPIAHNLGSTYLVLGNYTQALTYFEADLQTSRELGWERLAAFANMNIGYMLAALGDFVRGKLAFDEALASFRNLDCRPEQANILLTRAGLLRVQGNLTGAYEDCLQAIQIAEVENDPWQQASTLQGLAEILIDLGRLPQAIQMIEQALQLWQQLENPGQITSARATQASALFKQGQTEKAKELINLILPDLDQLTIEGAGVFLTVYQILAATQDERSKEVLMRGYQFVQAQLATIEDKQLQRSFQENIPVNRDLLALARDYADALH